MYINNINPNYENSKTNFKAKFLKSKSLELIADYAVKEGKFEKLNQSRKAIESSVPHTRLRVDIGLEHGRPSIAISKFVPKEGVIVPHNMNNLKYVKTTQYTSLKQEDLLRFALEKLIKFGTNTEHNRMYKQIMVKD